jgi:putative transposase
MIREVPQEADTMRGKRFTGEQIAFALKQAETGVCVVEACRKMGTAESTFFKWKNKFSGLGISDFRRPRQRQEENRKLKQLVLTLGAVQTPLALPAH